MEVDLRGIGLFVTLLNRPNLLLHESRVSLSDPIRQEPSALPT